MPPRAFFQRLTLALVLLCARRAAAADPSSPSDRYVLLAHGETHAELFQRALVPGTYGAIVANETALPVYQYVQLGARDLNIARSGSGFDMEVATWWRAELGSTNGEPPVDGDVQTANVGYHNGPIVLRFGRQHVAGGAARYARFDGLVLNAALGAGFDATVYGGLTVLPRWNEHPSYTYLGAAADSALKDPAVSTGRRERSDYWLTGARLGWGARHVRAGLSFHEQHEPGGVSHRSLALDETMEISPGISAGATGSGELTAKRISEARLWVDTAPASVLDWSFELLHLEPALFLSRQSVLSVFSVDDYDEAGTRAVARASEQISFEGGAWVELYSAGRPGSRSELALRVLGDKWGKTMVRLAYARVQTPDNGYHSLRSSFTRRLGARLSGTLEAYAYLYDQAIHASRSSTVYSGTLEYRPARAVGLLWGASLVHSPYANMDAQSELRLAYDFDFSTVRGGR